MLDHCNAMIEKSERDSNDNSGLETGRNCQDAEWDAERRRELVQRREQRDRKQRELEESEDPWEGILRTIARSQRRGLTVSTAVATGGADAPEAVVSLPFQPRYESVEFVFTDPLPDYIELNAFQAPDGPGRVLAAWLASFVPAHSDVIRVLGRQPEGNDWNSFGCAPLIAERARPPLDRQRRLLNPELSARMLPVTPHGPGRRTGPAEKPMQEMNIAFARDIYDIDTIAAAQVRGLEDYFLYPRDTKTGTFLINGEPRDKKVGSESRGGYRYTAAGRKLLSQLGAWPWCLSEDGRLPDKWYPQQDYAEALALWNYQQALALFASAIRSTPRASQPPRADRVELDAKALARDAHREMYMRWGFGREGDVD
jgi:hypothetical protein